MSAFSDRPLQVRLQRFAAACVGLAALVSLPASAADKAPAVRPPATGIAWQSLNPAQQAVLAPLQREWPTIDASRKQKWIEVAAVFPTMPQAERERVQQRMAEWARLTPAERGQARLQFQQTRQISPEDRQAQWDAYQALPEQTRLELAQRAKPNLAAKSAVPVSQANKTPMAAQVRKDNIVSGSGTRAAPAPKAISPTLVQAKPGATTTLLTKVPAPPAHEQPGLPKIAATEGFVNPATLLPRRGPQGAAVRSAAAAASESHP